MIEEGKGEFRKFQAKGNNYTIIGYKDIGGVKYEIYVDEDGNILPDEQQIVLSSLKSVPPAPRFNVTYTEVPDNFDDTASDTADYETPEYILDYGSEEFIELNESVYWNECDEDRFRVFVPFL